MQLKVEYCSLHLVPFVCIVPFQAVLHRDIHVLLLNRRCSWYHNYQLPSCISRWHHFCNLFSSEHNCDPRIFREDYSTTN